MNKKASKKVAPKVTYSPAMKAKRAKAMAARIEKIFELHNKGLTQKAIAKKVGLTESGVNYHLTK